MRTPIINSMWIEMHCFAQTNRREPNLILMNKAHFDAMVDEYKNYVSSIIEIKTDGGAKFAGANILIQNDCYTPVFCISTFNPIK